MRAELIHGRALVFGGTGAVGAEVLRGLARAKIPTVFTYHQNEAKAQSLAAELGQQAIQLELKDTAAVSSLVSTLAKEDPPITLFIHCAALLQSGTVSEISSSDFATMWSINVASAYAATSALAPRMQQTGRGELLFTGALDRTQSLPAPVAFSATQGALGALTMSLAKELGPLIRVNMVTFGPLKEGLSQQMSPRLLRDYQNFSALRRLGEPKEAASALLWLAVENRYISGEVLPVNGGI